MGIAEETLKVKEEKIIDERMLLMVIFVKWI
jgi:hypothetical protein